MIYFPTEHPVIKTASLTLKEVTAADLSAMEELVVYRQKNDLTALEVLAKKAADFKAKTAITWGAYLNNELVGTIGYYRGFENDIGEIGYVTRKDFRRKGLTAEAAEAVLNYGLTQMKLKQVVAFMNPDNTASKRLLLKLGFAEAGPFESYLKYQFIP